MDVILILVLVTLMMDVIDISVGYDGHSPSSSAYCLMRSLLAEILVSAQLIICNHRLEALQTDRTCVLLQNVCLLKNML